jgi:enediyne biosynthesis protein E4
MEARRRKAKSNKSQMKFSVLQYSMGLLLLAGCSTKQETGHLSLFTEIPASASGINFENKLTFDQRFNIYTYRNFYNGGGVALGDINNDGLIDIYFTSNQGSNKLYLNKGNFVFEDITDKAGVSGTRAWSTGVSMVDINGDGWLDIYVCNSGDVEGDNKENEFFINNGDLTFTERAKEFGVDDPGFTTHAAFFDYDGDGDLDLYILNNSYQAIGSFNLRKNERPNRDPLGGDKLFRNDGDHFTDVSTEAGIYGSVIGFGLGVTIGDINKDGRPDIYVSNDFFERDYLYINNGDGTFKECLTDYMKSVSGASMGADMADINNDGLPDIFVTEMLPADYNRLKTVTTFENWDRYQYSVSNDYYHQFTRNMLQINNGDGTFCELGRLAGVEATDWSWGALMFDMDNDGRKDIFVANGIYQDLTDQDYLQYVSNEEVIRSIVADNNVNYQKLVELIPSNPIPNFAFHNQGNFTFTDKAQVWGLGKPGFSNGSAYGDLDNDGDLDLVLNNVNSPASVYRNDAEKVFPENRYLKFELRGEGKNIGAWGTCIAVLHKGQEFYVEQMPNRGFQSSVDPRPVLGLGGIDTVEQVLVKWPDGRETRLHNVLTNQVLSLRQAEAMPPASGQVEQARSIFTEHSVRELAYVHKENDFVDFDRDKLLFHMLSSEGPRVAKGDVNGDNREDFYIGGARNNPGVMFIQQADGSFKEIKQMAFEADKLSEDQGSIFFDADGDGDLDLYVCSGSNEFSTSSEAYIDRLYINDGNGHFTKSSQVLPTNVFESTSVVKAADFDQDGDMDLFVGVRSHPFQYGVPQNGYLLQNDGTGQFTNVTDQLAPELLKAGMITDAVWLDIDQDGDLDLVLVGDYMPVKVFINESGKFTEKMNPIDGVETNGWWNRIVAADLDGDGDLDLVLGNHGLNSRFRASESKPVTMHVNDFDKNGTIEQIICTYYGDKSYPVVLRHDLTGQLPYLKKKYLKYESFRDQTMTDIFTADELTGSLVLEVFQLESAVLINKGKGQFSWHPLPVEAQVAPVYAIAVDDFDNDGNPDILIGGNLYRAKPEVGRYDASYGLLLKGDGKGAFVPMKSSQSGILIEGEVRDIVQLRVGAQSLVLVARNNDSLMFYRND